MNTADIFTVSYAVDSLCWISNDLLNSSVLVMGTSISDKPVSARRKKVQRRACREHVGRRFTQPEGLVLVLEPTQSTHEVLQLCHCLGLVPKLAVHIMPLVDMRRWRSPIGTRKPCSPHQAAVPPDSASCLQQRNLDPAAPLGEGLWRQ